VAVVSAISLRFVAGKDDTSLLIRLQAGVCMPIRPSHVECVTPEGLYLGQHADGGMKARKPGYDAAWLDRDIFVDLPATDAQAKAFYDFMTGKIGEPYDWKAIVGFATLTNEHLPNHAICSAVTVLGLRAPACCWFKWPLAKPAHEISPAFLLVMLSGMIEIPH
jgi:hypothetical protein